MHPPVSLLNRILLPVKHTSLPTVTRFLEKALSLPLHTESEGHATFVANGSTRLDLVGDFDAAPAGPDGAGVGVGASPTLVFTVQDMDSCVPFCISHGASMSSPIKFPAHGKVATVEVEGVMIGLYEPNEG